MKINKLVLPFAIPTVALVPVASVVSCGSSSSDYSVMEFTIDNAKCASLDSATFNAETNSVDKLKKIIKQAEVDRYTQDAMDLGLFTKIAIENNNVVMEMTNKKTNGDKTTYYSYRLPNGGLS